MKMIRIPYIRAAWSFLLLLLGGSILGGCQKMRDEEGVEPTLPTRVYSTISIRQMGAPLAPLRAGGDYTEGDYVPPAKHIDAGKWLQNVSSIYFQAKTAQYHPSYPLIRYFDDYRSVKPSPVASAPEGSFWMEEVGGSRAWFTGAFPVPPAKNVEISLALNANEHFRGTYRGFIPFDPEMKISEQMEGFGKGGLLFTSKDQLKGLTFHPDITKEMASGTYSTEVEKRKNNQFSATFEPVMALASVRISQDYMQSINQWSLNHNKHQTTFVEVPLLTEKPVSTMNSNSGSDVTSGVYLALRGAYYPVDDGYVKYPKHDEPNDNGRNKHHWWSLMPFFTIENGAKEAYLYPTKAGDRTMGADGKYDGLQSVMHQDFTDAGTFKNLDNATVEGKLVRLGHYKNLYFQQIEKQKGLPNMNYKTLARYMMPGLLYPSLPKDMDGGKAGDVVDLPYTARFFSKAPEDDISTNQYVPRHPQREYATHFPFFENSVGKGFSIPKVQKDEAMGRLPYMKVYFQIFADVSQIYFTTYHGYTADETRGYPSRYYYTRYPVFEEKAGTGQWYIITKTHEKLPNFPLKKNGQPEWFARERSGTEFAEGTGYNIFYGYDEPKGQQIEDLKNAFSTSSDMTCYPGLNFMPYTEKEKNSGKYQSIIDSYGVDGQGNPNAKWAEGYVRARTENLLGNEIRGSIMTLQDAMKGDYTDGSTGSREGEPHRRFIPLILFVGAEDGKLYYDLVAAQTQVPGQKVYTYPGRCLYRLLLNPIYDASGNLIGGDTRRNNIYEIVINDIQRLGLPYDPLDPDDPYLPMMGLPWEAELPNDLDAAIKYTPQSWTNIDIEAEL